MMRSFTKDAIVYALPMFLARAIGLILLPIYTRELGPTDFGFIEFVAAASAIVAVIVPLEINQAVARFLPENNDRQQRIAILITAMSFTVSAISLFCAITYPFLGKVLSVLNMPHLYIQYFFAISGALLVTSSVNLLQVFFRFLSRAAASVTVNLTVVIVNALLVLYFAHYDKLGILQYFFSQIIAGLCGVAVSILMLSVEYSGVKKRLDPKMLRELLTFSTPLVLSSFGMLLGATFDRLIIGAYVGLSELGSFGVAARLASIVGIGFYVVSTAMTPMVYRDHSTPEAKELIKKLFKLTIIGCLVLLAISSFFADSIVMLIAGNNYHGAKAYLFYILLSAIIGNLYVFFLGMDIAKNTRLISKINISAGLSGVLLSVATVPYFGVWGVIVSGALANLARLYAYIFYSQRLYFIPIKFRMGIFGFILIVMIDIFTSFK
jgi:O-antigen/teichoic acid export membrane protein